MRIAVLGATGFVGRALVPVLARARRGRRRLAARRRRSSRACARSARRRHRRERRCAARSTASRSSTTSSTRSARRTSPSVDRRAAETVAREAERAGVTQIVYLGGLGDDRPDLSEHLRSRIETAEGARRRAVPVTTLRAAVVVGRGSAAFETIVALVDRLPAMVAPRWISTPTQPIALADVVALPRRRRRAARRRSARASTSAAPTSSPTAR